MFAKIRGRRTTALATTLAVVVGLAITPAFTATAAEGDPIEGVQPIAIVESATPVVVPEAAPAAPEAAPVEAPPVEAPTADAPPIQEQLATPDAPESTSPILGHRSIAPLAAPPAQPAILTTTLPDATTGQAYSATLVTTPLDGAPGQNEFRLVGGVLPPTLTLDKRSGTITGIVIGTPQRYEFTIMLTIRKVESAPQLLSITVGTAAPVVTTTSLPTATVGTPYPATQLTASGVGPMTWSATGLAAGLSLNASTGVITGTPEYHPTYLAATSLPVTVIASNGRYSAPRTLVLAVSTPKPEIAAQLLPLAFVGSPYDQKVEVRHAYGDLTFSTLYSSPVGLELSQDGRIHGTPLYNPTTATQVVSIGFEVSNSVGSDAGSVNIVVVTSPPEITTLALPEGWVNEPFSQTITTEGPGVTLSVSELPDGLTFDGSTISGTPSSAGNHEITVTASNVADNDVKVFPFVINDKPNLQRMPVVTMETGEAFWGYPGIRGKQVTLALGADAPTGMSLDQGRIDWTPTAPGVYKFTITATNPAGADTQEYTIRVLDAPLVTQGDLGQAVINMPYRQQLEHDGTNVKFVVVRGSLPDGLKLTRNGVIRGTATEAGTFRFKVLAVNAIDRDSKWITLTVLEPATTLSASTVIRGNSLTVSGSGYLPGDTLELWLHSTPVLLGTVTATDGTFTSTVVIPANTPAGLHHLVVSGAKSGTHSVPVTIGLPAAVAPAVAAPQANQQSRGFQQAAVGPDEETTVSDSTQVEAPGETEVEAELETLDQPVADGEKPVAPAADWTGLVVGAFALLLAALLVLFLLWRRRRALES